MKRVTIEPGLHTIDTPNGIFTASGHWFRTRTSHIEALVPGLAAIEPLDGIVKQAEQWIRSTESLSLWLFLALLTFTGVHVAAVASIVFYLFWYFQRSGFASPALGGFVRAATADLPILLAAVAVVSWVGNAGRTADALIGLGWVFVFRFGWLRMLLDRWHDASRPLPMNDRILRMLLLRHAIRNGITPPILSSMTQDLNAAIRKSALVPLMLLSLSCTGIKWIEKPDDYRNALILVSDIPPEAVRFDAPVLLEASKTWFRDTAADSLYTLGITRTFFSPALREKNVRLAADYRNSDYRFVVESIHVRQAISFNFIKPGPVLKVVVGFKAYRGEELILEMTSSETANMAALAGGKPGLRWLGEAEKADTDLQKKALSKAYYTAVGNAVMTFFNQNTY